MTFFRQLQANRFAALLLLPVLLASVSAFVHALQPPRPEEPLGEYERRWGDLPENVLLVDARRAEDLAAGSVPGSLPLRPDYYEEDFFALTSSWLDAGQPPVAIFCYGEECATSKAEAARLRHDLGSDAVFYIRGGYEAWEAQ